jgi:hypothetical protein
MKYHINLKTGQFAQTSAPACLDKLGTMAKQLSGKANKENSK